MFWTNISSNHYWEVSGRIEFNKKCTPWKIIIDNWVDKSLIFTFDYWNIYGVIYNHIYKLACIIQDNFTVFLKRVCTDFNFVDSQTESQSGFRIHVEPDRTLTEGMWTTGSRFPTSINANLISMRRWKVSQSETWQEQNSIGFFPCQSA